MYFYQVQKHQQRIITNDYVIDENYVCSLTLKASIVLTLIQPINDSQKKVGIGLSRMKMQHLVNRLEECKQNRSYFRLIIHRYKTLVKQEDFDAGLVELLAVCHFLLDGDLYKQTNKIWFIQTSILEWRE